MKITIIISIIAVLATGTYFISNDIKNVIKDNQKINTQTGSIQNNTDTGSIEKEIQELNEEDTQDKISILRKRFSVKGIILKGDYFNESNQPLLALTKYLQALQSTPDDKKILSKIANTYFELKRFEKSTMYFEKALNYSEDINIDYIKSYLYSNFENLENKEVINKLSIKIDELNLNNEKTFYYKTAINCAADFHACKKDFGEYIETNKEFLTFEPLLDIKKQIAIYENFGVNNLYYKDSLITASLYENGLYPIAIYLGKDILKKKVNYKPILLIVGKSYFEIGDYTNAKNYLAKYYEISPDDESVTYLLGIITFKLKDYVSSNLYFNAAIKNGYTPKLDLERRLAYNYFLLGDKKGMLNVFKHIIENPESNIDDLSLGIYHAINEGNILTATNWAELGLEKYQEEENFYGYLGWIYRIEGDIAKAQLNLLKGLKQNPRNPLLTLNMGYLLEKKENYTKALEYFKTTISANEFGEFGTLAQEKVKLIEEYLKLKEQEEKEKTKKDL